MPDTADSELHILPCPLRSQQTRAQRYPACLAAMARHHTEAAVEGARQAYRVIRAELAGQVPLHEIEAVLEAYRAEGVKLAAAARAAALVEQALRRQAPHTQAMIPLLRIHSHCLHRHA